MKPSSWARDADIIENEVIMHRQTHRGSFLLLEGEDNHRFWDRRVSQGCELVIGDGKQNVEGAVRRLDTRRFSGALGIVDADFDRLQGRALPSPNLLAPMPTTWNACCCGRRPWMEYWPSTAIEPRSDASKPPKAARSGMPMLAHGLIFGRLRWLALRRGWNLPFDELGPERFTGRKTWEVDRDGLYAAVVTAGVPGSIADVHAAVSDLPDADPWSICRGHNLIGLLRIGLQQVLGDLKSSKGVADIAALLRRSFDRNDLFKVHSATRFAAGNRPIHRTGSFRLRHCDPTRRSVIRKGEVVKGQIDRRDAVVPDLSRPMGCFHLDLSHYPRRRQPACRVVLLTSVRPSRIYPMPIPGRVSVVESIQVGFNSPRICAGISPGYAVAGRGHRCLRRVGLPSKRRGPRRTAAASSLPCV